MQLYIILAAHFIADFTLQGAALAEKKTQKFRYLLRHVLIYTLVLAVAMFLSVPVCTAKLPLIVIAFSHFAIDGIRIGLDKKYKTPGVHFASFIVDQVLHILIIYVSVCVFQLNSQDTLWMFSRATRVPEDVIARYMLIFIVIMDPASVFVKKLSAYVSGTTEHGQKGETPVGSVIGKLERFIIVMLVLCGEIGAIGFVLTAKSLARFSQLGEKEFAEKYLVGTLSSTAIAITVTLMLK